MQNSSGWSFSMTLSSCLLEPMQTFGRYGILWKLVPQCILSAVKNCHLCFETTTLQVQYVMLNTSHCTERVNNHSLSNQSMPFKVTFHLPTDLSWCKTPRLLTCFLNIFFHAFNHWWCVSILFVTVSFFFFKIDEGLELHKCFKIQE